jgi:hypothetical protein
MERLYAAFLYALIAFLAGFVFGTLRELLVLPHTGLTVALLIELPFLTAISAAVALRIITHMRARETRVGLTLIGGIALGLLLVAEAGTAELVRGTSLFAQWAQFPPLALLINLTGLALFAVLPLLIGEVTRPGPSSLDRI